MLAKEGEAESGQSRVEKEEGVYTKVINLEPAIVPFFTTTRRTAFTHR